MKDNIKILKFLYEKKLEWANFCFIWGNNLWVWKWSNIPSYNSYFDICNWTLIDDIKVINELVLDGYLEKWKSWLTVSITNKWLEFYKNEIKPFYKKLDYRAIWWILIWVISILWIIIGAYYTILTFYFKK